MDEACEANSGDVARGAEDAFEVPDGFGSILIGKKRVLVSRNMYVYGTFLLFCVMFFDLGLVGWEKMFLGRE